MPPPTTIRSRGFVGQFPALVWSASKSTGARSWYQQGLWSPFVRCESYMAAYASRGTRAFFEVAVASALEFSFLDSSMTGDTRIQNERNRDDLALASDSRHVMLRLSVCGSHARRPTRVR